MKTTDKAQYLAPRAEYFELSQRLNILENFSAIGNIEDFESDGSL